jgi:RNA recognition motif-containing protein
MGTRLYVGNLSFSSTIETVREAFARIGEVTDVHIVTDRATGQSRGFGFVTMGSPAEAQKAIEAMNGASLDGRALRVNEAEERPQRGGGGGFGGGGHGGGGGGDRGRRGGGGGDRDRRNRW